MLMTLCCFVSAKNHWSILSIAKFSPVGFLAPRALTVGAEALPWGSLKANSPDKAFGYAPGGCYEFPLFEAPQCAFCYLPSIIHKRITFKQLKALFRAGRILIPAPLAPARGCDFVPWGALCSGAQGNSAMHHSNAGPESLAS
jgi:hypothetical protein